MVNATIRQAMSPMPIACENAPACHRLQSAQRTDRELFRRCYSTWSDTLSPRRTHPHVTVSHEHDINWAMPLRSFQLTLLGDSFERFRGALDAILTVVTVDRQQLHDLVGSARRRTRNVACGEINSL